MGLFDLFLGVSIRYDAGMKVEDCDTRFIDENTLQITGGVGLAVLITSEDVCASSFSSCKNKGKWGDWCKTATARHHDVLKRIASNVLGPWWPPPPTTAASDESADELVKGSPNQRWWYLGPGAPRASLVPPGQSASDSREDRERRLRFPPSIEDSLGW